MVELEKDVLPFPPWYRFRDVLLGEWQADDRWNCPKYNHSAHLEPVTFDWSPIIWVNRPLPFWVLQMLPDLSISSIYHFYLKRYLVRADPLAQISNCQSSFNRTVKSNYEMKDNTHF